MTPSGRRWRAGSPRVPPLAYVFLQRLYALYAMDITPERARKRFDKSAASLPVAVRKHYARFLNNVATYSKEIFWHFETHPTNALCESICRQMRDFIQIHRGASFEELRALVMDSYGLARAGITHRLPHRRWIASLQTCRPMRGRSTRRRSRPAATAVRVMAGAESGPNPDQEPETSFLSTLIGRSRPSFHFQLSGRCVLLSIGPSTSAAFSIRPSSLRPPDPTRRPRHATRWLAPCCGGFAGPGASCPAPIEKILC